MFQFTHPGRGATGIIVRTSNEGQVSIHAPREGCDFRLTSGLVSLRAFQFTHPGRGATHLCDKSSLCIRCFNSRTPGGVRRRSTLPYDQDAEFQFTHPGRGATASASARFFCTWVSIHAPREGCDKKFLCHTLIIMRCFNSRTPGGVRLEDEYHHYCEHRVSIHAPREGCDYRFNPFRLLAYQFQFTHPGRGATVLSSEVSQADKVSIHAPREGCDLLKCS